MQSILFFDISPLKEVMELKIVLKMKKSHCNGLKKTYYNQLLVCNYFHSFTGKAAVILLSSEPPDSIEKVIILPHRSHGLHLSQRESGFRSEALCLKSEMF